MSTGEGASTPFQTMRGRNYPTIRQFTVFLENRVGQLLEVVRRFENTGIKIVALSISDSAECAFVRFLVSQPERGREILERAGLAIIESDKMDLRTICNLFHVPSELFNDASNKTYSNTKEA